MTRPRRETRTLGIKLVRVDWAWIDRDLIRRHVTLQKYVAEVLEGEIAMQRQARGETRLRRTSLGPRIPIGRDRADRVLAGEP